MITDLRITDYEMRVLEIPERTIGDSQTHVFKTDELDDLYLEIKTNADVTGVGVDLFELRAPGRPSTETLQGRVDDVVEDIVGENPLVFLNRQPGLNPSNSTNVDRGNVLAATETAANGFSG